MLLWRALNTVKSVPYRLVRQLGESSIRSLICCSLLPEHDMSHHTITSSAFRSQPLHETKEMAADFFFSTAIAFRFYNPKMERLSGSLTYKTPATMAGCQYHLSTITRATQQLQPHPEQWQPHTTHSPLPRTTTLPLRDINKSKEATVSATNVVQLRTLLLRDSACAVDAYVYQTNTHCPCLQLTVFSY